MEFAFLAIGIVTGIALGYLLGRLGKKNTTTTITNVDGASYVHKDVYEESKSRVNELNNTVEQKEIECIDLHRVVAGHERTIEHLEKAAKQYEAQQERMQLEFERTAQGILEQRSRQLIEQNENQLATLLKPLDTRIREFEQKIDSIYVDQGKERAALGEQIRYLTELNQEMTQEARQLANALKGEAKKQGDWGEWILETILEKSGLRKGYEYATQANFINDDGRRRQPDVILNLPNQRHIIVDSKVSLVAYERYCTEEDEDQRKKHLKEHIRSLKQHIKGLSSKEYQKLYDLNSLDFVLLFVPIEPAFALALQADNQLFYDAFEQNIVLVSPTTLMSTARTISALWQQDLQNRHAQEIARQGGVLYDKLVLWVEQIQNVGKRIGQAQDAYQQTIYQLQVGKKSVLQHAENLRNLGAKNARKMPDNLVAGDEITLFQRKEGEEEQ